MSAGAGGVADSGDNASSADNVSSADSTRGARGARGARRAHTAGTAGTAHGTDRADRATRATRAAGANTAEPADGAPSVDEAARGDPTERAGATGHVGGRARAVSAVPTLNVANLLTVSRLVLVPAFVLALFHDGGTEPTWRYVAAAVFAVAALTDQVDGWIARRYSLITDFGKITDPLADKALIGAALVGLSVLGELPWWVTVTIAARELGVTLLRFWVLRHGVIPASRGGKVKTLAQVVAIVLYLLPLPATLDPVLWLCLGLALLLTVATGVDYLVQAVRLRAAGRVGG